MREIKFRAKVSEEQKELYQKINDPSNILITCPTDFVYGDLHLKCKHPHIHTDSLSKYWIDVDTIGQFTGLYDKNGTEIYEGDIIKTKTYFYGKEKEIIYEIKFDDDIENDSFGEPLTIGYCLLGSEYEVIGNIYDNPELMKGREETE